ncbi:hypothetical protein EKO27_g7472 [Xylaria grammica]|uniref:DNA replication complex GINS protein PSF3 n=1 Tax=Xylaria grammica TaxID=363999 RepID=A0A439CZJ9_9PEZI|nr:hypothetical protein EKO27_g7472 [Xylaria grammica]
MNAAEYGCLDAILTDAEKVPCKFELDVPELGYLDNNPAQPLKSGATIGLPLWLAELLALANRAPSSADEDAKSFVSLNLPPSLSNEVMSALKADPRAVPLRDQSHNFYGLGTRMLDLFEEKEICAILRRTFVTRAADIALHAGKAGATDDMGVGAGEDFLRGLEEWERKLFKKAHDGAKGTKEWMEGVKKH